MLKNYNMNAVSYKINIKNIDIDIINKLELEIRKSFDISFIAYDQFELIISLKTSLSDEQEEYLMKLIETFIYTKY